MLEGYPTSVLKMSSDGSWTNEEKETLNGNIVGDFLIDDLFEISNDYIDGAIGSSLEQIFHAYSSDLAPAVNQTVYGKSHHGEKSFEPGIMEQTLLQCNDMYPRINYKIDMDWLSGLEEDNSVFEASFLISGEHDFTYGSGMAQAACERTPQKFSSDESTTFQSETQANSGDGNALKTPVPVRARSKRPRPGDSFWSPSFLSDAPLIDRSDSSFDVSNTITPSDDFYSLCSDHSALDELDHDPSDVEAPPLDLKIKTSSSETKKRKASGLSKGQRHREPRRCRHCLTQTTPQWRQGPSGFKELCNACGMRFKSGRLFPEYKPAKSPSFVSYKHSNSHKTVLEMRHRKERQAHELSAAAEVIY